MQVLRLRLRFSLRTLFLLTTLVAGLCLLFLLPTFNAKNLLKAIDAEDYAAADKLFSDPHDRFLADWFENRWGMRTTAQLLPFTFGQFCHNRREVLLEITYFQFDQNCKVEVRLAATASGLKKLDISPAAVLGYFYEDRAKAENRPLREDNRPLKIVPKQ